MQMQSCIFAHLAYAAHDKLLTAWQSCFDMFALYPAHFVKDCRDVPRLAMTVLLQFFMHPQLTCGRHLMALVICRSRFCHWQLVLRIDS